MCCATHANSHTNAHALPRDLSHSHEHADAYQHANAHDYADININA